MTRAALLVVGMLTLAACSSGSDAEPPPPLDTEAPTTTIEPPPTDAPTTTAAETTTTVAETTTTMIEPTTTAEPQPLDSVVFDPEVVAEIDALAAEAFVDYETAWQLFRAAFEDPTNESIRAQLATVFSEGSGGSVSDLLDAQIDSGTVTLPPDDGLEQVVFLRSIGGTDTFIVFQTCETLSGTVVDIATGEPTYEGVDSYLTEVEMMKLDGMWLLSRTSTVEQFVGATCDT